MTRQHFNEKGDCPSCKASSTINGLSSQPVYPGEKEVSLRHPLQTLSTNSDHDLSQFSTLLR